VIKSLAWVHDEISEVATAVPAAGSTRPHLI
jgi:hypothetical protein